MNTETSAGIKDFLNNTLQEIMPALNAECGSLFIFDQKKEELVLSSYVTPGEVSINNTVKRRVGEGVSGKVIEIKTPVLVRDIDLDPRFNRNGFNHYQTKSFISIPLFDSDSLIGLINIADKSTGEAFSEKDLQFAVVLCKYACMVVDKMRNFTKLDDEKEVLNKQRAFLEKYATVGKLAAGVVHEVNNPLDGIIRYTNMLLNQADARSLDREYLLEIKKGLSRIANITKSLLEFSHLINADSPKFKKYVDIHDLIEEAIDILRTKFQNIEIIKKYDSKINRIIDMGISHVLLNIIKNAFDAMPEGGVLEICTYIKDSVVYISFKDTGTGIPFEIKEEIFKPFFSTKPIDKGTGLGLAICNEIVNKYNGKIEVQSSTGTGSIFTILIPCKYLEK